MVSDEMVDSTAQAITKWLGYAWDGLPEGSIIERGFPVFTHGQFGWKFQAHKDDMRNFARELIEAALRAAGEPVAWQMRRRRTDITDAQWSDWEIREREPSDRSNYAEFEVRPLYTHPAPSDLERELDEARAERDEWKNATQKYELTVNRLLAERAALAADKARLVEALEPFASAVAKTDAKADRVGFAPSFDDYVAEWSFSFGQLRRARAALGTFIPAPASAGSQPVKLIYTNWRGETAERTITPLRVFFGSTEWHPEPQWLLRAFDHDKQAERDFALKDFGNPASADPAEARREALEEAAKIADSFAKNNRGGRSPEAFAAYTVSTEIARYVRALANPARREGDTWGQWERAQQEKERGR
ncbi:WYL domain-containing protein [Pseudaminobacter salicylatoxidans]|uniref:WYL domain-containing protein n=1 Tax=Pseudaminobacter salicylatoxidans TaxID=93369 RepID=UPI0002E8B68B|nr:WYL domain-containing protein [Pseudaminobacter salicylatoxidans]